LDRKPTLAQVRRAQKSLVRKFLRSKNLKNCSVGISVDQIHLEVRVQNEAQTSEIPGEYQGIPVLVRMVGTIRPRKV
jgi:hypothetical protein